MVNRVERLLSWALTPVLAPKLVLLPTLGTDLSLHECACSISLSLSSQHLILKSIICRAMHWYPDISSL